MHRPIVQEALEFGFGRQQVHGHTSAAWLIERHCATAAERMCSLPPDEAERWVALAQIEVGPQLEQGLASRDVLVMVERGGLPAFDASPPAVSLFDLLVDAADGRGDGGSGSSSAGASADEESAEDFIEVQVVDARGRPRPSVRYELRFPDGTATSGTTDADGMVRHERLDQAGDCVLVLPDVAEAA